MCARSPCTRVRLPVNTSVSRVLAMWKRQGHGDGDGQVGPPLREEASHSWCTTGVCSSQYSWWRNTSINNVFSNSISASQPKRTWMETLGGGAAFYQHGLATTGGDAHTNALISQVCTPSFDYVSRSTNWVNISRCNWLSLPNWSNPLISG